MWSLFCPHECPGLHETYGEEFEKLYEGYERAGKALRVVEAQKLWFAIVDAQIETGTPYMLFKGMYVGFSHRSAGTHHAAA